MIPSGGVCVSAQAWNCLTFENERTNERTVRDGNPHLLLLFFLFLLLLSCRLLTPLPSPLLVTHHCNYDYTFFLSTKLRTRLVVYWRRHYIRFAYTQQQRGRFFLIPTLSLSFIFLSTSKNKIIYSTTRAPPSLPPWRVRSRSYTVRNLGIKLYLPCHHTR
jgi:hypothetical protein